ncbi:MAG TPA: phosphohistidine phosphatase SixA, partial [Coleofasciculaceae cyanobacterium]
SVINSNRHDRLLNLLQQHDGPLAMELYLIRHGIAADRGTYANDDDRPLTAAGQTKTQAIAERFVQLDLHLDCLMTSPLVRAQQTAEIFYQAGLADRLEICPDLAPGRPIESWLDRYAQWQQTAPSTGQTTSQNTTTPRRLGLVGHEPTLSHWANQLLWNPTNDARDTIVLKKAGIIGLILPPEGSPLGQSQLFWLTPPRLFL